MEIETKSIKNESKLCTRYYIRDGEVSRRNKKPVVNKTKDKFWMNLNKFKKGQKLGALNR